MDAERLLNLKQAVRYLEEKHGLRYTVGTMRVKRARGQAPEFFIPDGMRDLRTTEALLDAWVAKCRAHPSKRGSYPDPQRAQDFLQLARVARELAHEPPPRLEKLADGGTCLHYGDGRKIYSYAWDVVDGRRVLRDEPTQ